MRYCVYNILKTAPRQFVLMVYPVEGEPFTRKFSGMKRANEWVKQWSAGRFSGERKLPK